MDEEVKESDTESCGCFHGHVCTCVNLHVCVLFERTVSLTSKYGSVCVCVCLLLCLPDPAPSGMQQNRLICVKQQRGGEHEELHLYLHLLSSVYITGTHVPLLEQSLLSGCHLKGSAAHLGLSVCCLHWSERDQMLLLL